MDFYSFPSASNYTLAANDGWWPGTKNGVTLRMVADLLGRIKISFEEAFGKERVNGRTVNIIYITGDPYCWPLTNLIALSADGAYPQYAYQFAHELCHCIVSFYRAKGFQWFEEILCQMASIYFMENVANSNPLILSENEFAPDILTAVITDQFPQYILQMKSGAQSFHVNQMAASEDMQKKFKLDPYQRLHNRYVVILLLPIFRRYPYLWKATLSLKNVPKDICDVNALFASWREVAPLDYGEGISAVANVFGVGQ